MNIQPTCKRVGSLNKANVEEVRSERLRVNYFLYMSLINLIMWGRGSCLCQRNARPIDGLRIAIDLVNKTVHFVLFNNPRNNNQQHHVNQAQWIAEFKITATVTSKLLNFQQREIAVDPSIHKRTQIDKAPKSMHDSCKSI